jgi:hypothetical protein
VHPRVPRAPQPTRPYCLTQMRLRLRVGPCQQILQSITTSGCRRTPDLDTLAALQRCCSGWSSSSCLTHCCGSLFQRAGTSCIEGPSRRLETPAIENTQQALPPSNDCWCCCAAGSALRLVVNGLGCLHHSQQRQCRQTGLVAKHDLLERSRNQPGNCQTDTSHPSVSSCLDLFS